MRENWPKKRIFTPTTGDTGLPSAADTPSAARAENGASHLP
jgi:hypothetical protein